jgi:gas vesicle protein
MISTIADYYMSLNPIALIAAYLPLLTGLIVWFSFYIRYDRGVLMKLQLTLLRIANSAKDFTKCRLDNLKTMNELAEDLATPQFEAAWKKMLSQVEERYTEEIIPEAECFFRQEVLITVPAHRSSVKTIWGVSAALLLLSLMLPQVLELYLRMPMPGAATAGVIPAIFIIIFQLIFTALDLTVINNALDAYHRFIFAFDSALPTASEMAGPALLLDATRKNQRSFETFTEELKDNFTKNTDKISNAIDEFANGGVLPAIRETMKTLTSDFLVPASNEIKDKLDQALKAVIERQETGMRELTDSFANKLADTLEYRINALSDSLKTYQNHLEEQNRLYSQRVEEQNNSHSNRMNELGEAHRSQMEEQNTRFEGRIDSLNSLLVQNMQNLTGFIEKQHQTMERSEEILAQAASLYQAEKDNTAKFNINLDNMYQITERFRSQTEKFADDTIAYSERSLESQQKFNTLVSEVTNNMQDALAGAGREIAHGINQAVEDNAKAIADLTEQAAALRQDYDTFFTRSDESTKQTMEEMDYQIQGLITRMSQDIGVLMNDAIEKNGSILSQYKDQTTDILQSFDEQARSIGLYAKEINLDITELSSNLNSSVGEFTEKIKEGIQVSISEFDTGLAELTKRISNTVESIADAVENLPASIKASGNRE